MTVATPTESRVQTWLEMSREEAHGGDGWAFGECLWVPARKKDGTRWPYWDNLRRVRKGDVIVHLKGKDVDAAFVGSSIATSDGMETRNRPPNPQDWAFAKSFLHVPLRDFAFFSAPVNLRGIFRARNEELRRYFLRNKERPRAFRQSLFFVIQSNRLQCLNGAYLSSFDSELAELFLGTVAPPIAGASRSIVRDVYTGQQLRLVQSRVGQADFSNQVRKNYGSRCSFPGCDVTDAGFLVGAHIARWADANLWRGKLENGMCLCLMHDKAFEDGLFTIDGQRCIRVNPRLAENSDWARKHLTPFEGLGIGSSQVAPSIDMLRLHWQRIGFMPGDSPGQ
jgi:putative restriction endonuclease